VSGTAAPSNSHLGVHHRRRQELLQISPVLFADSSQRLAASTFGGDLETQTPPQFFAELL
jgi:hypothetical protein